MVDDVWFQLMSQYSACMGNSFLYVGFTLALSGAHTKIFAVKICKHQTRILVKRCYVYTSFQVLEQRSHFCQSLRIWWHLGGLPDVYCKVVKSDSHQWPMEFRLNALQVISYMSVEFMPVVSTQIAFRITWANLEKIRTPGLHQRTSSANWPGVEWSVLNVCF